MKKKSFTQGDYEITEREVLYQGIFRLARYTLRHRLFNGGWSDVFKREVLERLSAAALLPYDPHLDRVILIEQFRPGSIAHPVSPWLIEIVAGVLDKVETPDAVAIREAKEEAGCDITEMEPICDYFVSPGGTNEYLHIYCGKVDSREVKGIHGLESEHEDIRVLNLSAEEAFALIPEGHIKNAPAMIALMWLQMNRERLQKQWQ